MLYNYLTITIIIFCIGFIGLLITSLNHSLSEDSKYDEFSKQQWKNGVRNCLFFTLLSPLWPITAPLAIVLPLFLLFRYAIRVTLDKD